MRCVNHPELAENYASFYLNAWNFYRSGYHDTDAARKAVLSGVQVLELGLEIGNQ